MSEFDNEKRGALFRNAEKKSERSPDYSGRITIDGREYQLAGWLTESKFGKTYLSLKARIPEPVQNSESFADVPAVEKTEPQPADDQSEIPF